MNVFSDTNEAAKAKKTLEETLAAIIRLRHGETQPQPSTSVSASIPVRDKFSPWTILGNIVGTQQTNKVAQLTYLNVNLDPKRFKI
ncbi:unnamed protein product [Euphydryas editha]|uniref:Uncharacterized protein n=1 Tax=Euphydryas editha TaxID=104508 RepID=A0AAU9VFE6_EUPED|nr:unnamed protein product [Euphydryas editha]